MIIERNGLVYNFDFHSYVYECSSFYANFLDKALGLIDEKQNNQKGHGRAQANSTLNKKMRPFSAVDLKNKPSTDRGQPLQAFQRVQEITKLDSNHSVESLSKYFSYVLFIF